MPPRDKRGRLIGFNWWREMNMEIFTHATDAWERECEAVAIGYDTEIREYAEQHPRPNLKQILLANKGYAREEYR